MVLFPSKQCHLSLLIMPLHNQHYHNERAPCVYTSGHAGGRAVQKPFHNQHGHNERASHPCGYAGACAGRSTD